MHPSMEMEDIRRHGGGGGGGRGGRPPVIRVLMFPWLAHGHISPFLELSKRLSLRNFDVHLCSTPANLASIKDLHGTNTSHIHLVHLHLPALPDLPPDLHTTKHLPPHLMPLLKTALDLAEPSFARLLADLSPHLLIYDFLQPWAPLAASRRGIPSLLFFPTGAATSSFFLHHLTRPPGEEFPFPPLRFGKAELDRLIPLLHRTSNGITDSERVTLCVERSSPFFLIKTFRGIESGYIDYLGSLTGKEIVPLGPLVPEIAPGSHENERNCRPFVEWLDRKPESSTVFVSFGSEYFMSEVEIQEVARGLELSGVPFIWVVRFPDDEKSKGKGGLDEALPSGFRERMAKEKRGMVVEGWAPQRVILAHRSTGGFVTHCGWSSVMEAMRFGVPMVAMPAQLDQPLNARLVVDLGVGVEAVLGRGGGEDVARVVRKVVVEDEGEEVRRKAREMGRKVAERGEEEVEVLAWKLVELCKGY